MPSHAARSPRSTRLHAERLESRLTLTGDIDSAGSLPIIGTAGDGGPVAALIDTSLAAPAGFSAGTAAAMPDRPWIRHAIAAEHGAVVFQVRLAAGPDGTITFQTLPIWARLNPPGEAAPLPLDDTAMADAITATAFVADVGSGVEPLAMPLESLLAGPPPLSGGNGEVFVVVESPSDILLAITTAGVVLAGAPGRPDETIQDPPKDGASGPPSDDVPAVTYPVWLGTLLSPASDGLADATGPAAAWLADARAGDTGAFVLWSVPTGAETPPLFVPLYARFNPATAEDPAFAPDRERPSVTRLHGPAGDDAPIEFAPGTDPPADLAAGFLVVHTDSNFEIMLGTILPLFLALADSPGALPDADTAGLALLAGALLPRTAPPAPEVSLLHDTGTHADDRITADGRLAVSESPQTKVEYSIDGGRTWKPEHRARQGDNAVLVRQVDAFGQPSEPTTFTFQLDTRAPAAPRPRLADVPAGVTNPLRRNATLVVDGTEAGARLEYSADGGPWLASWTPQEGPNSVRVRQIDAAGNVSAPSPATRVRIDTVVAAPGVALARDTGRRADDRITADARLAFVGLEPGAKVRYSVDGGAIWTGSYRPVEGRNVVLVRQLDLAGNLSAPVAFEFTLDTTKPRGATAALQPATPRDPALPLIGAVAADERVEYREGRGGWREDPPSPRGRMTVRVRVVDAAGNVSRVARVLPAPPERS